MTALGTGSLPYPGMDITEALASLAPDDTAMVPTFTPRRGLVLAARTDPGALARAAAGVQGIDWAALDAAKAVPGLTHADARSAVVPDVLPRVPVIPDADKIFAAMDAERSGTGPPPNFAPPEAAPAPDPVPGWPEGVVRGLLIAALWEACRWYGDMDGTGCRDCEALGGLCDWHAPKYARYWAYSDLHDFAVDAASDAAALAAVADSVRSGKAEVADLANPGSHLDLILAGTYAAAVLAARTILPLKVTGTEGGAR